MKNAKRKMEHELKHECENGSFFRFGPDQDASFVQMHDLT